MIASVKSRDEINVIRVEHNDLCIEGDTLSKVLQGSSKLVNLGLYAMKRMLPHLKRFTLMDDSFLYCNGGDQGPSISLAYETILKYNQTWYQQKCGAVLPGFVSWAEPSNVTPLPDHMIDIPMLINRKPMVMRVVRESIMAYYLDSLKVLDEPCRPWEVYAKGDMHIDGILPYREIYENSSSPRDFIQRLRDSLGKDYCITVHKWFNHYIRQLGIKDFKDNWIIPVEHVPTPPDFFASKMTESNARTRLNGGKAKRQTRKSGRWHIGPRTVSSNSFRTWDA